MTNPWDKAQTITKATSSCSAKLEGIVTVGDSINPEHYRKADIECIDAIAAALGPDGFKEYCRGQVMKYLWRYQHKGKPREDLAKADWYLQRLRGEL